MNRVQLLDVRMLPAGISELTASPDQVAHAVVAGSNAQTAAAQEPITTWLKQGWYIVETVPAGEFSHLMARIETTHRQRRDREEFLSWDKGRGRDPEWNAIRSIVGSRPLGG